MLLISSSLPEENLLGSGFGFLSSGNFLKMPIVGLVSSFFSERLC